MQTVVSTAYGGVRSFAVAAVVGDQPKVCARIANRKHEAVPDEDGSYLTGNCEPIER